MAFFRPALFAAAALLPTLAACGGDDGEGTVTPEGTHYYYVSNKIFVPTTNTQAREYGLDLNKDGTVDNQLGMVLSTLGSMGFDIQATIDKSVATGSIILLQDFQTKDFSNTTAAGIQVYLGDMPNPPACAAGEMYNDMTKMGCGRHLAPGSSFAIAQGSPQNAALAGKIIGGKFTGGPGDLSLQIALGGTEAIQLNLIGARAQATGITADAIGGVIFAGAITKEDIDTKVIPQIQSQLGPIIMRDCPTATMANNCLCGDNTTGKTILGLFDANKDCTVSVMEIQTNSLIVSLLSPDVTINGKMALSLGIKATAVKATYTVAGQ